MKTKAILTAGATALVAIFGAQLAHQMLGSPTGAKGMLIKGAAGTAGVLLVRKLA